MANLRKTKRMNRNPFYDNICYESDIVNVVFRSKGRSSHKYKYKNKYMRHRQW